jgi:cold shock CspA family protein
MTKELSSGSTTPGFGFITCDGTEVFVHHTAIQAVASALDGGTGRHVQCVGPKGVQAEHHSGPLSGHFTDRRDRSPHRGGFR